MYNVKHENQGELYWLVWTGYVNKPCIVSMADASQVWAWWELSSAQVPAGILLTPEPEGGQKQFICTGRRKNVILRKNVIFN